MENQQKVQLTQYSRGGGCGCKIAPAVLQSILGNLSMSSVRPAELLVGYQTSDDAAVWDIGGGNALVSTVDFFMPVVDDPFDFGRVAAANALSDVYAMGGKPLFANAVLGWPVDKLAPELASKVIDGALNICKSAGVALSGGHSIDSPEPFFGLAVNGIVATAHVKMNSTAKAGNLIYLTKPLGLGVLASAAKKGLLTPAQEQEWIKTLCTLNNIGTTLGAASWVQSMTDVTGFGFLGHLLEMCRGSGLDAEINYTAIPLIAGAQGFMEQFIFPDNTYRNWNAFEPYVEGISGNSFIALCDPQTSGGLLVAVDPAFRERWTELCINHNIDKAFHDPVGKFTSAGEGRVKIVN